MRGAGVVSYGTMAELRPMPSVSEPTDEALLRRFQGGETAALEQLCARHLDASYRVALGFTGNAMDAEDAVQSAFLHLLTREAASRFRGQSSVKGWIMSIVVNACREQARSASRRRNREQTAPVRPPHENRHEQEELNRVIRAKVQELPDEYRLPVWLHYLEQLTLREVGIALDLTEDAAEKRVSRGLDKLRQALAASGVTAAALPGLLAALPLEAAPAGLLSSLPAMLATPHAAAAKAGSFSLFGGTVMKVAAVVVLATAATTGALVISTQDRSPEPQKESASIREEKAEPSAPVAAPAAAPEAAPGESLGSSAFVPTPERPVGWRGDGTGRYPGATPPKEWYVRLKNCPGLFSQSSKPTQPPAKIEPNQDIALNDWIAIGPWPVTDKKQAMDTLFLADEAAVSPNEGDKVGDKQWKKWPVQYGGGNFAEMFGDSREAGAAPWSVPKQQKVIYAHTYIYAPVEGPATFFWGHFDACRIYLNGEMIVTKNEYAYPRNTAITLKQGWNRLLLKSWGYNKLWSFSGWVRMLPKKPYEYENKNLVYSVPLPGFSITACPVVVGSRIFITGDHFVMALNKQDGRMLWYHTLVPHDGRAQSANGDAAAAEPYNALCARLHELDKQYPAQFRDGKIPADMQATYKQIQGELRAMLEKVDPKRAATFKQPLQQAEPGWSVTPCSDGKNIYVWSQLAVADCFDLDGKLVWSTTIDHDGDTHHGFTAAPVILDGKLICKQSKISAFDLNTGALLWRTRGSFSWGSMVRAKAGDEPVLVEQDNVFHHTKDGELFHGDKGCKSGPHNTMTSPVVFNDCFALSVTKDIVISELYPKLQHTTIPWPDYSLGGDSYSDIPVASPIWHDGLVYISTMGGILIIVDTKAKKVVGMERLDARTIWGGRAGSTASPCFAGGLLYFFDDSGNTFIREPGVQGKVIARNSLVSQFNWTNGPYPANTTPVLDESRIYWRIGNHLYCIGEK